MANNFFDEKHTTEKMNFGVSPRGEAEKKGDIWADFDAVIDMARKPMVKGQMSEVYSLRRDEKPKAGPGRNTTSPTRRVLSFVPGSFGKDDSISEVETNAGGSTEGWSIVPMAKAELLPREGSDSPSDADRFSINGPVELQTQRSSSQNSASMSNSSQDDVRSMVMASPQVDDWLSSTQDNRAYLSPVDRQFHRIPLSRKPLLSPTVEYLGLPRDVRLPIGQQEQPVYLPNSSVRGILRYRPSPIGQSGLIQRTDVTNPYRIRFGGPTGNYTRSQLLNGPTPASGVPVSRVGLPSSYCLDVERQRSSGDGQPSQVQHHISIGTSRPGSSMESRETMSPRRANVLSTHLGQSANHRRHPRPRGAAMTCVSGSQLMHAPASVEEVDEQTTLGASKTGVRSSQSNLTESPNTSNLSTIIKVEQTTDCNPGRCEMELQSISSLDWSESSPRMEESKSSIRMYNLEEINDSPRTIKCEESVCANIEYLSGGMVVNNRKKKGKVRRAFIHLQKGLRRVGRRFEDLVTACIKM